MTYDYKDLNDLHTDDFLEFGSSGKSFNKSIIINFAITKKSLLKQAFLIWFISLFLVFIYK
ncbi:hypothetical protein PDK32_28270 [Bacillus cereus]|nr:hypothetical protein [Bacillus cereus]